MPTGYTVFIEDGKITNGKDFLKLCIRAFGVCSDQREDSLSEPLRTHFECGDYYQRRLRDVENDIMKYKNMSDEELYEDERKMLEGEINGLEESIKKINKQNDMYSKIACEIEKWDPPTYKHNDIKEFALKQIDMSIEDPSYVRTSIAENKEALENLSIDSISQTRKDILERLEQDKQYYEDKIAEERNRVDSRNLFMKQFLDSLNAM